MASAALALAPLADERHVEQLSDELAHLHVAQARAHNMRLHDEQASADAEIDALCAELCTRTSQRRGLVRVQEQLSVRVPPPPPVAAVRLASAGEKRKGSDAHDEAFARRVELGSDVRSASDDDTDLLCARSEAGSEPAEANAGWLGSASVYDELRHELRTRARLEVLLGRKAQRLAALRERVARNDLLIARLEALNDSLLLDLQQARDRHAAEVHAKRVRAVVNGPADGLLEHVRCF
ncbi:hypothetical protein KFE25_013250 [Diacronema lutheri]|uniref:Uncharacterized protein n=2 Tax=Diacronema lutheri TaxID=2081491 RepID=A0A8J6C905_DIALT|nr:hypothetical protein KFE25_004297 [Diacronema lutheri]KAG8468167.1 hypothetical protein KFE25_013250 [Diacronema lutheri]